MSVISKINNLLPYLTDTGLVIAQYVLENPEKTVQMTVKELAWETKTSPAAVIRFSKRLGYEGFPSFKMDLAVDINAPSQTPLEEKSPSLQTNPFFNHAQTLFTNALIQSFQVLHKQQYQQALHKIRQAPNLYLAGSGSTSSLCEHLRIKLSHIGILANHHPDPTQAFIQCRLLHQDDVIIIIDVDGQHPVLVDLAKQARLTHTTVIALTQDRDSPLIKNSDHLLAIPNQVYDDVILGDIIYHQAILRIIDLLLLGLKELQNQN